MCSPTTAAAPTEDDEAGKEEEEEEEEEGKEEPWPALAAPSPEAPGTRIEPADADAEGAVGKAPVAP